MPRFATLLAVLSLLCAPALAQTTYPQIRTGWPTYLESATPKNYVDGVAAGKLDLAQVMLTSQDVTVCATGCNYVTISAAQGAVRGMLAIAPFVTFTIRPADGVYTLTSPIYTAENLSSMRIIGNCTTAGATVFRFTNIVGNNGSGVVAEAGGRIGRAGAPGLDCITLLGVGSRTNRSTWTAQSYGAGAFALGTGSTIYFGPKMVVDSFYYSALADQGGRFNGNGGTFRNAGDTNLLARFGGVIECQACTAQTASDITTDLYGNALNLGHNILAEGGYAYVDNAVVSDGQVACVGAQSNGMMWAHQVHGTGCIGSGARVIQGGVMEITHAVFSTSGTGAFVGEGGIMNVDGAELHHNTYDGLLNQGGRAFGSALNSHDNGGYGVRTENQGQSKLFSTLALLLNNTSGPYYTAIMAGCTNTYSMCQPAATTVIP